MPRWKELSRAALAPPPTVTAPSAAEATPCGDAGILSQESALAQAVRQQDIFQVQALLRDRADPNERAATGSGPLLLQAAGSGPGALDLMALLLGAAADPGCEAVGGAGDATRGGAAENSDGLARPAVSLRLRRIFAGRRADSEEERALLATLDPGALAHARRFLKLPGPFALGGPAPVACLQQPGRPSAHTPAVACHEVWLHGADTLRPALVLHPRQQPPTALFVLLHGLFQSGPMLARVAAALSTALPHVRVLLPTAPTRVTYGVGPAWCNYLDGAERLLHLQESRAEILALLSWQGQEAGLGPDRVVLGGFSMGGNLAAWTALHLPRPLAGLLLLGTEGLCEQECREAPASAAGLGGCATLQCHGGADALVPASQARQGAARLEKRGARVEFSEHSEVGHALSLDMLDEVQSWLRERLPPASP